MTQRILIDAIHTDEIRVAVADDNRLQEFDFENVAKKQIKSNIYLGKVTRVEPSLQAAFVEYGGNRQGFLPFSEVHFDYYQIPVADKEKILAEIAASEVSVEEEKAVNDDSVENEDSDESKDKVVAADKAEDTKAVVEVAEIAEITEDPLADVAKIATKKLGGDEAAAIEKQAVAAKEAALDDVFSRGDSGRNNKLPRTNTSRNDDSKVSNILDGSRVSEVSEVDEEKHYEGEEVGGGDEAEDARRSRGSFFRRYKIQEVLKRNQILLVQIIKEERGNKGASLTTYISLAGRYGVLMPNTDRAGGVSRRISDIKERKRLKNIISSVELPQGASVIIRTAGVGKSPDEINRDYTYLLNIWEEIRQNAVHSTAPALVHEEGDLIKRSLRDLYRSNIGEVIVEGEAAYKIANNFVKAMAPDQVKYIKQYKGTKPIFMSYGIDEQLDDLYDNEVKLKSGGSIVITPTEALVSIDVNSGKSTKEKSIEDTALKTNIEAAYEVARQLRLRDLAGLVVIDFIDMREHKNRRAVERALKEALKTDRAKIQVGRISVFGLMEMSRQRMRSSIVEASTQTCQRCKGTGLIRSETSTVIKLLRGLIMEAKKEDVIEIHMNTSLASAMNLLNNKREAISDIEKEYDVKIYIDSDSDLIGSAFNVDKKYKAKSTNNYRKPAAKKEDNHQPAKQNKQEAKPQQKRGRKPHPKASAAKGDGNVAVIEDHIDDNVGNNISQPANSSPKKPVRNSRSKKKPASNQSNVVQAPIVNNDANKAPVNVLNDDGEKSKLKGLWEKITQ